MTLERYDTEVGFNLKMIREHAGSCLFYVNRMMGRPDFETLALDDLQRLQKELLSALETTMQAEARYHAKQPRIGA